jgi:hypothetical protein
MVYVGTTNSIVAYGLLNPPASVPAASAASALQPHLGLSQVTSNDASASLASGLTTDVRSAIPASDDENSAHRLDQLFPAEIVKGSSAPPFVQLDSTESVNRRPTRADESDGLPLSAIDEVFRGF